MLNTGTRLKKMRATQIELRNLRIQEKEENKIKANGETVTEKSFANMKKAKRFLFRGARGLIGK